MHRIIRAKAGRSSGLHGDISRHVRGWPLRSIDNGWWLFRGLKAGSVADYHEHSDRYGQCHKPTNNAYQKV